MNMIFFLFVVITSMCAALHPKVWYSPIEYLQSSVEWSLFVHLTEDTKFVPTFLRNSSKAVQKQFCQIIRNGAVTLEEMKAEVRNWVDVQDDDVKVHSCCFWLRKKESSLAYFVICTVWSNGLSRHWLTCTLVTFPPTLFLIFGISRYFRHLSRRTRSLSKIVLAEFSKASTYQHLRIFREQY